MADYKMIPVDDETYQIVAVLCEAYGMPKRSQGAMVKKLAKADYEKLAAVKLVSPIPSVESEASKSPKKKSAVKA